MKSVIAIFNVIAVGSGLPQDPSPHLLTFSNRVILLVTSWRTMGSTMLWCGRTSPADRAAKEQDVLGEGHRNFSHCQVAHKPPEGTHTCTRAHTRYNKCLSMCFPFDMLPFETCLHYLQLARYLDLHPYHTVQQSCILWYLTMLNTLLTMHNTGLPWWLSG